MILSRCVAVAAAVLSAGLSPSVVHGNCNVVPHDGIAENGFGASPGFSIEYCGLIQPPPECTVDGWYFPVSQGTSFTRTGGQTSLSYTSVIREAVNAPLARSSTLLPGPPQIVIQAMVIDIPTFPNSSINDVPVVLSPVVRPHFSCAVMDGDVSPGVFILEDRSPTTPLNPGFGSSNGGPFESLLDISFEFRALGTSAVVTPFSAQIDGFQVVPPVSTSVAGRAQVDWTGDVDIQIPSLSGTTADIRILRGQEGTNGPPVCTFSNAAIPFSGSCPALAGPELIPLITARIYTEIDGDRLSEGLVTVRGQIIPANLLYVDGFETGDLDRWSSVSR